MNNNSNWPEKSPELFPIKNIIPYNEILSKPCPKILIIGQAPPISEQDLPYDTTMLYDWLKSVGINKLDAQKYFDFEAVSNVFPGVNKQGGHKPPTMKAIKSHWPVLESKIQLSDKVWLLGSVASKVFHTMPKTWSCNIQVLETIHPSKRNCHAYSQDKENILYKIKQFINP